MKKNRKILAVLLAVMMLLSMTAFAANDSKKFSDLKSTDESYDSVMKLVDAGVINGYPDGTFKPQNNVTRAEFVKMVNIVFGFTADDKPAEVKLSDIAGEWYEDNVRIAVAKKYINGYTDGTFKGGNNITRQEVCKIICTIGGVFDLKFNGTISDKVDNWAKEYVEKILANYLMPLEKNNTFRATQPMTREEVALLLAKFAKESKPADGGTGVVPGGSTGGSTGGSIGDNPGGKEPSESQAALLSSISKTIDGLADAISYGGTTEENAIVSDIKSCMEKVLAQGNSGVEITADYVKTNYSSEIAAVKSEYYALSSEEQSHFKAFVSHYIDLDDVDLLVDYFIN